MSFDGVVKMGGGLGFLVFGCVWNRFDLLLIVVLRLVWLVCFNLALTLENSLVCT